MVDIKNRLNLSLAWDKTLLVFACIYFFGVLFWLTQQQKQPPSGSEVSSVESNIVEKPLSPKQTQFIQYLKTALTQLEKGQSLNPPPTKPSSSKSAALPSYPLPTVQPAPTVVERIYVPIYPPQEAAPPSVSKQSPAAPSTRTVPPPPPPIAPPIGVNPAPPIISSRQPIAPDSVDNELIGLLSGDRGFALVKINGSTQRFEPGEVIGSSGWVLNYVVDQTAVISRNGQQRMIEVGQRF